MAQLVTITVDELDNIKGRITKAQKEIIKIATEELRDYGRILRAKLQEEAPKREGVLASTVRMNTRQADTKNVHLEMTVGNKQRPEVIVKTILFGSKPHIIRAKKAKALAWGPIIGTTKGGKPKHQFVAKQVHHPGTAPNNFLERSLELTKSDRVGKRVTLRVAEKIMTGKG